MKVTLGLLQHACGADTGSNTARALALAERAADRGARVICTQELFASQYFCQSESRANFALAETIPGPTTDAFAQFAKRRGVVVSVSLFERRARGLHHNTAAVIDADGTLLGVYRKMHIPDDPLYYEKYYFAPGDTGFRVFKTRFGRIGVLICWDQWFPEGARLAALGGAEILLIPTAIGWHPKEKKSLGARQLDSWLTIQRAHAVANGCFVAACNRVGKERPAGGDGLEFWGNSFAADTSGQVVAKAGASREQVLLADLDLSEIDSTRQYWPFLRDRRVDAYSGLTRRFLE